MFFKGHDAPIRFSGYRELLSRPYDAEKVRKRPLTVGLRIKIRSSRITSQKSLSCGCTQATSVSLRKSYEAGAISRRNAQERRSHWYTVGLHVKLLERTNKFDFDATRRVRCERSLSLTLVWFDALTRSVWTGLKNGVAVLNLKYRWTHSAEFSPVTQYRPTR